DSTVLRCCSKRARYKAVIHSRVASSSTGQRLAIRVPAPAMRKARRSPNSPSPAGEVRTGESALALRRAFRIAGAGARIARRLPEDEEGTRESWRWLYG